MGAVVEEKMPSVLGGVFLHYAGEGAEAGAPFYTQKRIKIQLIDRYGCIYRFTVDT